MGETIYEVHYRRPGDAESRVKWFRVLTGGGDGDEANDRSWLVGYLADLGWSVLAVFPRPVDAV